MEATRSMLSHADLSNAYWAEAVATATYLHNQIVSVALKSGQTPYQLWFGDKPHLKHLRVFGCVVYVHVPDGERKKLDQKAVKLRFIGYTETTGNYKVWNEEKRKCYVRHDVVFNECDFGKSNVTEVEVEVNEQSAEVQKQEESESESNEHEEIPAAEPLRCSERVSKKPIRYGINEFSNVATHVAYLAAKIDEPTTIECALNGDYSKEWKSAADLEYSSLVENETWDLVRLPKGRTTIGCKWIFRVKYDGKGNIERFKGRLVAQGFSQKYGVDYLEIFSPVARFSSIWILLAFAAKNKLLVHQMDVVSAFLNGELKEEIYMQQPPGYLQSGKEEFICKLRKSIYGLKQSPRCWNAKLSDYLKSLGFKESGADPCVFIKSCKLQIIAVYVDDLILMPETVQEMEEMKEGLASTFRMKDMGELCFCLGINFERNDEGISLCQKQYLMKLLAKYRLSEANTVSTPMDSNVKLEKDDGYSKKVDAVQYYCTQLEQLVLILLLLSVQFQSSMLPPHKHI